MKEFEEQLTTASNDQLINDYNKFKEELESLFDYITDGIRLPGMRKVRNQQNIF